MLSFNCPQCNRFCAVLEKYAGRRIRCTGCSCRFFAPAQQGEKAKLYLDTPLPPLPAFYRQVFIKSWKALFCKDSIVGLIFCIAMSCFQFYFGNLDYSFTLGAFRPPLIVGWITQFLTLGGLFWYFLHTIGCTLSAPDCLPELEIGFGFEYFGNLFKSIFLFLNALLLTAIPGIAAGAAIESFGLAHLYIKIIMLAISGTLLPLWLGLFGCGFPTWIIFRLDILVRTVTRTIKPYLTVAMLTVPIFFGWLVSLQTFSTIKDRTLLDTTFYLVFRAAMIILMLFVMRAIGLYFRHYKPACPWLWNIKNQY